MKPALLKKFAVNEILQRELQLCLHVVPLVKSSGRWLSERRRNLVKFRTSLARVAKIIRSWLKETYIISSYSRGYRIKSQKKPQRRRVFPARGQS